MKENILQYESKIWATADTLRGSGIKESEWPPMMMPFFALMMVESRLIRMFDEVRAELGEEEIKEMDQEELSEYVSDRGQGFNSYIFEQGMTLTDICKNDKTFETDFTTYLRAFDGETKDLLGVDATDGDKFLDIHGVISKMKAKKKLFGWVKGWSEIDLRPFDNSEITTLEEHIKRKWADISAETAGEQYTPNDIIALIAEIVASKVEDDPEKILRLYDCTCGGGNLLFGVEDRIKEKLERFTATYGQDWNDALYALARIESRFRKGSKIEYGNTLNNDKFPYEEFDVCIANPPYGVDWKDDKKSILDDKTGRFHYHPSVSDGQLLFMQHLISKLNSTGIAVVVHNGSSLFSGDAGSAESNIRKWMLDNDLVEAVIQNPTNEFFNTGIYTYLWVLNKNKPAERKDKVMLIDASEKCVPLKKNKGDKRVEIDAENRQTIVQTLEAYQDNDFSRVFSKYHFYYNKQAIELTNLDEDGKSFIDHLPMVTKRDGTEERAKSQKLDATSLTNGNLTLETLEISDLPTQEPLIARAQEADAPLYDDLKDAFDRYWKPLIASLDYKEQDFVITTKDSSYRFDSERETLVKTIGGQAEALGCGKILVKASYVAEKTKKATKIKPAETTPAHILIKVELTADLQKDHEIIPFNSDPETNQQQIADFMAKYIFKPFVYLDNVVGAEINFNKIFYKPEPLRPVETILGELKALEGDLADLELTL